MSATSTLDTTTDSTTRDVPEDTQNESSETTAERQAPSIGTGTDLSHESSSFTDRTPTGAPESVAPAQPHTPGLSARDTVATRLSGSLPEPVFMTVPSDFHARQPEHTVPVDPLPRLSRIPRIDPAGLPPAFSRVRFKPTENRETTLIYALGAWLNALTTPTETAASHLDAFLKTPAVLESESLRNAILTAIQEPGAIHIQSYDDWQAHRREVQQGEQAIWTWWTITAPRCPDCGHGPRDHVYGDTDCERTPDDKSWGYGPVAHSPRPRFDYAQTDRNPIDKAYNQPKADTPRSPADVAANLPHLSAENTTVEFVTTDKYPGAPTTAATLSGWTPYTGNHHVYINTDAGPTMRVRDAITTIAQAALLPPTTTPTRDEYPARFADADAAATMVLHLLNTPPASGFDPAHILNAWQPLTPNRLLSRLERITTLANAMRSKLQIPLA